MKINITKNQYWNLLRATYMADWMANAICEQDMKEDDGIKEIRNYVFSFVKEYGCEKYAKHNEDFKEYFATWNLDDEPSIRKLINRYEEHTFWDETIERLAERDFLKKYTKEEIKKMSDEEYYVKQMECEDVWNDEFEKNGIERLYILKQTAKK
jgi:hypothetical protein